MQRKFRHKTFNWIMNKISIKLFWKLTTNVDGFSRNKIKCKDNHYQKIVMCAVQILLWDVYWLTNSEESQRT
jgi:hypothetical protein